MNQVDQTNAIRARVAKLFKSRCFVCHKKVTTGKGFLFHHLWYTGNDVFFANYKNRLEYNRALESVIQENPARFLLLCSKHHYAVESNIRYNPDTLARLLKAVRKTTKARVAIAEGRKP